MAGFFDDIATPVGPAPALTATPKVPLPHLRPAVAPKAAAAPVQKGLFDDIATPVGPAPVTAKAPASTPKVPPAAPPAAPPAPAVAAPKLPGQIAAIPKDARGNPILTPPALTKPGQPQKFDPQVIGGAIGDVLAKGASTDVTMISKQIPGGAGAVKTVTNITSGMADGAGYKTGALADTATTLSGGKPTFKPAPPEAAFPTDWSNTDQVEKWFGFQLGQSYPEMAGGVATGAAASYLFGPGVGLAGTAAVGGAIYTGLGVAESLGPIYAQNLASGKFTSQQAALDDAIVQAGKQGLLSGAGGALFAYAPFASALKNILLQSAVVQPALQASAQFAGNVAAGKDPMDGVVATYIQTAAGTLVPVAAFHAMWSIAKAGPAASGAKPATDAGTPPAPPGGPPGAPSEPDPSGVTSLKEMDPTVAWPIWYRTMADEGWTDVQIRARWTKTVGTAPPAGMPNIGGDTSAPGGAAVRPGAVAPGPPPVPAPASPADAAALAAHPELGQPPAPSASAPTATVTAETVDPADYEARLALLHARPGETVTATRPPSIFADIATEVPTEAPPAEAPTAPAAGTRTAPVVVAHPDDLTQAEQAVKADPTPAQAAAGNYPKGHMVLPVLGGGFPISIETAAGGVRSGVGEDGTQWQVAMPAAYGYIRNTKAADGEQLDVFVGSDPQSGQAFIVNQTDTAGKFDELKVIVGVQTPEQAKALYLKSFASDFGHNTLGSIHQLSMDDLKAFLNTPGAAEKPYKPPEEHPGLIIQSLRPGAKPEVMQPAGTVQPKAGQTKIGFNNRGQTLYEDKNGVRSVVEDGVRTTEAVGMRPTRGGVQATIEHEGDYLTQAESNAAATAAHADEEPAAKKKVPAQRTPQFKWPMIEDERIGATRNPLRKFINDLPPADFEYLLSTFGDVQYGPKFPSMAAVSLDDPEKILGEWRQALAERDKAAKKPKTPQVEAMPGTAPLGAKPKAATIHNAHGDALAMAPEAVQEILNDPKVKAALAKPYKVDRTKFIPYMAGYSNDGKTIYIHRDIPTTIKVKSTYQGQIARYIKPDTYLALHEHVEKTLIDVLGYKYQGAHQIAVGAEHAALAAVGLDPESYEAALAPAKRALRGATLDHADVPTDLDVTPYLDSGQKIPAKMDMPEGPHGSLEARDEVRAENGVEPANNDEVATAPNKPEPYTPVEPDETISSPTRQGTQGAPHVSINLKRAGNEWRMGLSTIAGGGPITDTLYPTREDAIRAAFPKIEKSIAAEHKLLALGEHTAIRPSISKAALAKLEPWFDALKAQYAPKAPAAAPKSVEAGGVFPAGIEAARDRMLAEGFSNILVARKFLEANGWKPAEPEMPLAKQMDEAIELATVLAGREIVAKAKSPAAAYDALVDLYENKQPKLGQRTGKSMAEQAYSTPLPLAYIASRQAGITAKTDVLEPTAGNGALLIEASPAHAVANEIDPVRRQALQDQGFATQGQNATEAGTITFAKRNGRVGKASGTPFDVVVMNPPFGSVREDGRVQSWDPLGDGWKTRNIDHAIALTALKAMKDDGRAVLIIGAPAGRENGTGLELEAARKAGYNEAPRREFMWRLYGNYNVVDHFTVAGDLYAKQGAGWPVDVIVIDGRGKSALPLPGAAVPPIFGTWDALKAKVNERSRGALPAEPRGKGGAAPDQADLGQQQPETGNAGSRQPARGERPVGGQPARAPDAGEVRPGGDRSESVDAEPDAEPARGVQPAERGERGGSDVVAPARERKPRVTNASGQTTYQPKSTNRDFNSLVPANMVDAVAGALDRVTASNGGNIDAFVGRELDYGANELAARFSAEQVDAIALGIDAVKHGSALVLGDQTGIGKGRVVAAMIRYATLHDMFPVFVTEKPDLYGDMYRDLRDIGMPDLKLAMTNTSADVPLDEEAVDWRSEMDAAIEAKTTRPPRRGQFLKSGDTQKQSALFQGIHSGAAGGPDVMFTTYDQMNTLKGADTPRRQFMRAIAPRAMILLDEAHNAGGQGDKGWKGKDDPQDRAAFIREVIDQAKGVIYSSATWAKRPDVMDLYRRTDMGKAVENPKQLPALIQRGGIPLQQVVSSMLAKSGQYIRRERDFTGIDFAFETMPVDSKVYADFTEAVGAIFRFDLAVKKDRSNFMDSALAAMGAGQGKDNAVGEAGASSTEFSSIMHNLVNQMLLSIQTKPTVEAAVAAFKAGQKPVIALSNTMESFLSDYASENDLKNGHPVDATFGTLLHRYLDRALRITIKNPDKTLTYVNIPVSKLSGAGQAAYRQAEAAIDRGDYASMPVSPIDALREGLEDAGLKVAEITGRQKIIKRGVLADRPASEQGTAGKRVTVRKFNTGKIDALILNRSGSTGISLHTSPDSDGRQRHMFITQADANIDTYMQTLGRINRTGQTVLPRYTQAVADVPAATRPAAVLMKKMASLNANTTSARKSTFTAEAVDFMNRYGNQVISQILADDPMLNQRLGTPYTGSDADVGDAVIRKATGRIVLLKPDEQAALYDRLAQDYTSLIDNLNALGENTLEARSADLQARTLETQELKAASGPQEILSAANLERVSIKSQGRAMSPDEVVDAVTATLADNGESLKGQPVERLTQASRMIATAYRGRMLAAEAAYQKWRTEVIGGLRDPEMQKSAGAKADGDFQRFQRLTSLLTPGRIVTVRASGSEMPAVVIELRRAGDAKNPVALGSWRVKLALPDGARSATFSLNQMEAQVLGGGPVDPVKEGNISVAPSGMSPRDVMAAFDQARLEGREIRHIITGNVLAGYDLAGARGQIINHTTEGGEIRPGVLMPRTFDPVKFMAARAVRFPTAKTAAAFVAKHADSPINSLDGYAEVGRSSRGYYVKTGASKATGGRYYLDSKVRAAVGDRFEKKTTGMLADGLSEKQAADAIQAMMNLNAVFETKDEQASAAAIVKGAPPKRDIQAQRGVYGNEPLSSSQLTDDTLRQFQNDAQAALSRVAGKRVRVNFYGKIHLPVGAAMGDAKAAAGGVPLSETVGGTYESREGLPLDSIVSIALDEPDPATAASHEGMHDVQRRALNNQEKGLLVKDAASPRSTLRPFAAKALGPEVVDHLTQRELEAYAFEQYDRLDRKAKAGSGLSIGIRRAFDKLGAIRGALRHLLGRPRYRSVKQLFAGISRGELGERLDALRAAAEQQGQRPTPELEIEAQRTPTVSPDDEPEEETNPKKVMQAFADETADDLFKLRSNGQKDRIEFRQGIKAAAKAIDASGMEYDPETLYAHGEGDPLAARLTPDQQAFWDEFIAPDKAIESDMHDEATRLAAKMGLSTAERDELVSADYMHRMVRGRTPEVDAVLGGAEIGDPVQGDRSGRSLARMTSSMKSRVFFAAESKDGERIVVSQRKDGTVVRWEDNRPHRIAGTNEATEVKTGNTILIDGEPWAIRDAVTREIEAATPFRYYRDPIIATKLNILYLKKVIRNLKFMRQFKRNPVFLDNFTSGHNQAPPRGWVRVDAPALHGWMAATIGNVVNDYLHGARLIEGGDGGLIDTAIEKAEGINRVVTSSLFLLPTKHLLNIASHYFVGRGWEWANPAGYVRAVRSLTRAAREVMTDGALYKRYLKSGASLMASRITDANFVENALRDLGYTIEKNRPAWRKLLGVPGDWMAGIARGIYRYSSIAMWRGGDTFMLARYIENGMKEPIDDEEAIHDAEELIPNYRIPSKVAGSRLLSKAMQDPLFSRFMSYRYGQFRAYARMLGKIFGRDRSLADRAEGLGEALAHGALYLLLYGAGMGLTAVGKSLFGNQFPDIAVAPVGALTIGLDVLGVALGNKNVFAVLGTWASQQILSPINVAWNLAEQWAGGEFVLAAPNKLKPGDSPIGYMQKFTRAADTSPAQQFARRLDVLGSNVPIIGIGEDAATYGIGDQLAGQGLGLNLSPSKTPVASGPPPKPRFGTPAGARPVPVAKSGGAASVAPRFGPAPVRHKP